MAKIVSEINGLTSYVSLPTPLWRDRRGVQIGTGLWLRALWATPRSKRYFAETYSIWEDTCAPGTVIGRTVYELDKDTFIRHSKQAGIN